MEAVKMDFDKTTTVVLTTSDLFCIEALISEQINKAFNKNQDTSKLEHLRTIIRNAKDPMICYQAVCSHTPSHDEVGA
jgi:hypothetical protein